MITGTAYKSLEQSHRYCIHFWSNVYRNCIQVFGAISQIMHTLLHFGPLLTGTAYYLLEHCFQVLHMPFGAKLTHTAYFLMGHCSKILHNTSQSKAQRFCILPFGAILPDTVTVCFLWDQCSRMCCIPPIWTMLSNSQVMHTLPAGPMPMVTAYSILIIYRKIIILL